MNDSTDWNARYESGETPWEKGGPHPELAAILRRFPLASPVLVPGCGTGHDVRRIAETRVEVLGVDIASAAVQRAEDFAPVGSETYRVANLFALDAERAFAGLFEHTCFCAIDPALRKTYATSVSRLLKSGGTFAAIFFIEPGLDPGESGPPFGVASEELDQLFAPNFVLLEEWIPVSTYLGREGRELCRIYRKREG